MQADAGRLDALFGSERRSAPKAKMWRDRVQWHSVEAMLPSKVGCGGGELPMALLVIAGAQ
jgi:hypothetical protein